MADSGKVVLFSTDPASNLKDVLESPVDENINPVKGIDKLFAINIDPENSAEEYRNRVTQPLGFFKSRNQENAEDLSEHALQKLLPLMNFLVLYREKQKEKIYYFSTPLQRSHLTT
jgi:anion-transporting  ArsA/GET3 family ATPase